MSWGAALIVAPICLFVLGMSRYETCVAYLVAGALLLAWPSKKP